MNLKFSILGGLYIVENAIVGLRISMISIATPPINIVRLFVTPFILI